MNNYLEKKLICHCFFPKQKVNLWKLIEPLLFFWHVFFQHVFFFPDYFFVQDCSWFLKHFFSLFSLCCFTVFKHA